MNKFKLIIDGDSVRELTIEKLQEAVFNLQDDTDSFIVLEPKVPIDNSIYIQAICQEDKYIAETRLIFDSIDNYKHYSQTFSNKEDLFEVFANYYQKQQLPNIKKWIDETNNFSIPDDISGVEMVKLYKTDPEETQYFEVWLNDDDVSLTIHTGTVGYTGMTEDIFYDEEGDLPVKVAMSQLITAQKEMGYKTINLTELIIQYPFTNIEANIKDQIEASLNECLGWTGNGHCEGGDAENQLLNLFCYVVDKDLAVDTILYTLKEEDLSTDIKIAYADEKTEEYISLYPKRGQSFELM